MLQEYSEKNFHIVCDQNAELLERLKCYQSSPSQLTADLIRFRAENLSLKLAVENRDAKIKQLEESEEQLKAKLSALLETSSNNSYDATRSSSRQNNPRAVVNSRSPFNCDQSSVPLSRDNSSLNLSIAPLPPPSISQSIPEKRAPSPKIRKQFSIATTNITSLLGQNSTSQTKAAASSTAIPAAADSSSIFVDQFKKSTSSKTPLKTTLTSPSANAMTGKSPHLRSGSLQIYQTCQQQPPPPPPPQQSQQFPTAQASLSSDHNISSQSFLTPNSLLKATHHPTSQQFASSSQHFHKAISQPQTIYKKASQSNEVQHQPAQTSSCTSRKASLHLTRSPSQLAMSSGFYLPKTHANKENALPFRSPLLSPPSIKPDDDVILWGGQLLSATVEHTSKQLTPTNSKQLRRTPSSSALVFSEGMAATATSPDNFFSMPVTTAILCSPTDNSESRPLSRVESTSKQQQSQDEYDMLGMYRVPKKEPSVQTLLKKPSASFFRHQSSMNSATTQTVSSSSTDNSHHHHHNSSKHSRRSIHNSSSSAQETKRANITVTATIDLQLELKNLTSPHVSERNTSINLEDTKAKFGSGLGALSLNQPSHLIPQSYNSIIVASHQPSSSSQQQPGRCDTSDTCNASFVINCNLDHLVKSKSNYKEPGRMKQTLEGIISLTISDQPSNSNDKTLPKNSSGDNLFEHFFVFGASQAETSSRGDNDTQRLQPTVQLRYPKDSRDSREGVFPLFAFPEGVETQRIGITDSLSKMHSILYANYVVENNPNCFTFVLKTEDSFKRLDQTGQSFNSSFLSQCNPSRMLYGITFRIDDVLEPSELNSGAHKRYSTRLQSEEQLSSYWTTKRALCFVSYYPFQKLFLDILSYILNQLKMERINEEISSLQQTKNRLTFAQRIEKVLQRTNEITGKSLLETILCMPKPSLGMILRLNFDAACSFSLCIPTTQHEVRYIEAEEQLLLVFSSMRCEMFVSLLLGVLTEQPTVVVSENSALLASVILSVSSLIKPFKYPHPLITLLPASLIHLLDSPVPIFVGLNLPQTAVIQQGLLYSHESCTFVFLDESTSDRSQTANKGFNQGTTTARDSPFFQKFIETLSPVFASINQQMNFIRKPQQISTNILGIAQQQHSTLSHLVHPPATNNANANSLRQACREAIFKVAQLLKTEIFDLIPPRNIALKDQVIDFDLIEGLLLSKIKQKDELLRKVLKTQIFNYYLEEFYFHHPQDC